MFTAEAIGYSQKNLELTALNGGAALEVIIRENLNRLFVM